MKVRLLAATALAALLALLLFTGGGSAKPKPQLPRGFFGVARNDEMKLGGPRSS